jgi:hypothetical protein
MKTSQCLTMLSGIVLGAVVWLPTIAQHGASATAMVPLTVEAAGTPTAEAERLAAGQNRSEPLHAALEMPSGSDAFVPALGSGQSFTFPLASVSGVSLGDDIKTIYELKGNPLSVKQDDILPSSKIYTFEDCQIGMSNGAIQYVSVPAAAGQINIDGQVLPLKLDELKNKLGKPYFEAEDGIVYRVRNNALKMYVDPANGSLVAVHFFPAAGE